MNMIIFNRRMSDNAARTLYSSKLLMEFVLNGYCICGRVADPDNFAGSLQIFIIWIRLPKSWENQIFFNKNIEFINIQTKPNLSKHVFEARML